MDRERGSVGRGSAVDVAPPRIDSVRRLGGVLPSVEEIVAAVEAGVDDMEVAS